MSNDERIGFLVGYRDFINVTNSGGAFPFIRDLMQRIPLTYNEMLSGITKECMAPENVTLPIFESFAIFLYRLSGATESEVNEYAAECRKQHLLGAVKKK